MVSRAKDIKGEKFGSLTAIKLDHVSNRMAYWEYKCDCGKSHIARSNTITYVAKKGDPELPSCGCIELERKTKHGFRKSKDTHPAYKTYRGVINRCYNPNVPTYKWYGQVGVTVADVWLNNPKAFVEWSINNGWKEGLHLDKDIKCKELGICPAIYSPETCQWITPQENVSEATNRDNYGKHPNVRLSKEQVTEILELYNSGKVTNQSELARMYNLKSSSSIQRLISLQNQ